MSKYTFIHNLDLQEKFKPDYPSRNIAMMHDKIALHEKDILDLIQITFDWTRSWDAKPRYEISPEYSVFSFTKTWSLLNVDSKWNRENIQKGVEFLSNHLDYLPEFIVDSTYTIMGECLGYKVHDKRFILPESDAEYKELLELGKCHLAVLMIFIEELGKIGVDCRALRINTKPFFVGGRVSDCLEGENYLGELRKIFRIQEYWLHGRDTMAKGPKDIVDKSFQYDTDKVYRQLKFNDLEEFFTMLLQIIDRLCTFSSEMIDPSTLDFTKYYYPNKALPNSYDLPDGKFVDAKECIKSFLEKLKKGEFIEAYYHTKDNITIEEPGSFEAKSNSEITSLSTQNEVSVDPKILREFIAYLLAKNYIYVTSTNTLAVNETIDTNPELLTHNFLVENQEYYPENHADQFYYMAYYIDNYLNMIKKQAKNVIIVPPANNSKDFTIDSNEEIIQELVRRIRVIEERQNELDGRVDALSDELASFKEQILTYLETGQNKPDLSKLSPQKATEIIKNIEVQSVGGKIRKRLLLMALALGMIGLLKSSNISLIGQFEDKKPVDSKPPVVDIIPPVSSQGVEDVLITPTPKIPQEEKISVHILDEDNGLRDYYTSIYDCERSGVTNQNGVIIRYFAFQNDILMATFGREEELQSFVANNNVADFTWKIAVSCFDSSVLQRYLDDGDEIPLQYTTFFADYIPTKDITRLRKN